MTLSFLRYIKLFFLYLILEKIIWLFPFLVLMILGLPFAFGLPETPSIAIGLIVLTFSLLAVGVFWYFKKYKGINIFSYTKITTLTSSKRNLWISFLILILYIGYVVVLHSDYVIDLLYLVHRKPITLSLLGATFILVLWEEIVARGIILQNLIGKIGFWRANIISALIFVAVHYLLSGGNAWQENFLFTWTNLNLVSVLIRFVLGFMAGIIFRTSNSLWFAVILHLCHNIL